MSARKYLKATLAALAAFAIACTERGPLSPTTEDKPETTTTASGATFIPMGGFDRIIEIPSAEVCKVGSSASIEISNGVDPAEVGEFADGDCFTVAYDNGSVQVISATEIGAPPGFQLDSIVRDTFTIDPEGNATHSVSKLTSVSGSNIIVSANAAGRLTFYNSPVPPPVTTVTLCKVGSASTFSMSVDGGAASAVSLGDGECRVVHTTAPGGSDAVAVTENVPSGFILDHIVVAQDNAAPTTLTGTTSATANATPDGGARITFYNRSAPPPPPTTITLCKVGSSASFEVSGTGGTIVTLTDGECRIIVTTTAGGTSTVNVTELPITDYTLDSIVVQSSGSAPVVLTGTAMSSATANPAGGARITYYNRHTPPPPPPPTKVTLCKVGSAATFAVSVDGGAATSASLTDGECRLIFTTAPGGSNSVNFTEAVPSGTVLDSIVITPTTGTGTPVKLTGTNTATGTATPAAGSNVTFYNRVLPPPPPPTTVTLCKIGSASTFNYSANGGASTTTSLNDGECKVIHTTASNGTSSVTMVEAVPSGYALDSIKVTPASGPATKIVGTNSATVTVTPAGNVKVTFYNRRLPPPPPPPTTITLCKKGSSGTFNITKGHTTTTLTLNDGECRLIDTTAPGGTDQVTITEVVHSSCSLDSIIAIPVPSSYGPRVKKTNTTSITVVADPSHGQIVTFYNKRLPPPPPPPTTIKICKVGTSATFTVAQGYNSSTASLANGECKVVVTTAPGQSATATITEKTSSAYVLDSIIVTTLPVNGSTPTKVKKTGTAAATVTASTTANILLTYYNHPSAPPPPANQGCSYGYWKQSSHYDSWVGYATTTQFSAVFENAFPGKTLLQVLSLSPTNSLNALGRQAVASLLNSKNTHVHYALTTAQVISQFNAVYPNGNYDSLKNTWEGYNSNCSCPLN